MRKRWLTAACLTLVVVLVAPASLASAATAKRIVKVGRIRLADLPTGWLEEASDEESPIDIDELIEDIPECAKVKSAIEDKSRQEAESPDFEKGDNEISNSVDAFKDVATAKRVMRGGA